MMHPSFLWQSLALRKVTVNENMRIAAVTGDASKLISFLSHPECDPLAKNHRGLNALMEAAYNGNTHCVKILLPVSDALARDHHGRTALTAAVFYGDPEAVLHLLPVSDLQSSDNRGLTALMWAAIFGHLSCTQILLPLVNALATDHAGLTASDHARSKGYDLLSQLIEHYTHVVNEKYTLSDVTPHWTSRHRLFGSLMTNAVS